MSETILLCLTPNLRQWKAEQVLGLWATVYSIHTSNAYDNFQCHTIGNKPRGHSTTGHADCKNLYSLPAQVFYWIDMNVNNNSTFSSTASFSYKTNQFLSILFLSSSTTSFRWLAGRCQASRPNMLPVKYRTDTTLYKSPYRMQLIISLTRFIDGCSAFLIFACR